MARVDQSTEPGGFRCGVVARGALMQVAKSGLKMGPWA